MIFTEIGRKIVIEFQDDDSPEDRKIAISMFELCKALIKRNIFLKKMGE